MAALHYGLCSKVTLGEYGSGLQLAEGWPAEQERIPIFYYYSFVEVTHVLIARVCVFAPTSPPSNAADYIPHVIARDRT